MLILTLTLVAIAISALVAHRSGDASQGTPSVARLLETRTLPVIVFAVTFLVLWYSWAAITPMPVVHDEMAYVLQAEIFARFKWALPSPPMPDAWSQPHVLVEPMLASKYFPGHSLLLSLGALVGWVPLMPLVLQSLAAVLVFIMARRLAGGAVALATWAFWLQAPMVLYFGASYYSEATTIVCWLGGWYALREWRTSHRRSALVMVALFTGWGAITRPLTGVAYAIPIAFVVLRERRWKDMAYAIAAGTVVMSILLLWSARSTGDWSVTPLTLYTKMYMPYDVPGFGLRATPPAHWITPEQVQINNIYGAFHVDHFPSRLPALFVERSKYLAISFWGGSLGVMSVFALVGLTVLTAETLFALASAVVLLVTYLTFATPATWTLYYYEVTPVLAFLTASGFARALTWVGRPRAVPPAPTFDWRSARWARALVAGVVAFALPGLVELQTIHLQHRDDRKYLVAFYRLLRTIPDKKAIVFVRYAGTHNPHVAFVRNTADPERERIWVVYDRGETENQRLLAVAPGRKAYLFDELQGRTYLYEPR